MNKYLQELLSELNMNLTPCNDALNQKRRCKYTVSSNNPVGGSVVHFITKTGVIHHLEKIKQYRSWIESDSAFTSQL